MFGPKSAGKGRQCCFSAQAFFGINPVTEAIPVMPELARFFGIIIRMFSEPSERHYVAHFHAYCGEHEAVFSISPVALVIGFLPQRQQRFVEA